jgi:hypothetical protein
MFWRRESCQVRVDGRGARPQRRRRTVAAAERRTRYSALKLTTLELPCGPRAQGCPPSVSSSPFAFLYFSASMCDAPFARNTLGIFAFTR